MIEINETKLQTVIDNIWEGAIHEYCACTGHPQLTRRQNPRSWLLKLWTEGGFLMTNKPFVPHYIRREVQKRYTWITAEDVLHRLRDLRNTQEKAKRAEREVVQEHDYSNILTYFNCMSELRREETEVRDYVMKCY